MTRIGDMTEGKPLRQMVWFSMPMLAANALQLTYTVVDSAVLGRMLGINAFASVLATTSLWWLVFAVMLGITIGFGAYFAQRFGAKDMDTLKRSIVTAAYLSGALGVIIGCSMFISTDSLLKVMNTPPELMAGSALFLRVMFGGMPIVFAYNLLSSVLRSIGDSKTPLRVMIISTLVNIALDFAFVTPFGIAGVAAATLTSWALAGVLCLRAVLKTGIMKGASTRFEAACARELLRLGLPMGLRNAVIEVGALVAQWYVNGYGAEFVAGVGAAKRMYSLLMIAGSAFEAAVGTFVGQNTGAGRLDRVKRGVRDGLKLMLASSAAIAAIALIFGRSILSLLVSGEPEQLAIVLDYGVRQLNVLALGLPLVYLLCMYRAALQSMGKPLVPTLSGFFELVPRMASVIILTPAFGMWGVYLSDPSGWVPAVVLLAIAYYVTIQKMQKR